MQRGAVWGHARQHGAMGIDWVRSPAVELTAQKVGRKRQRVARVDVWLADARLVRNRSNGRQLCDEANGRDAALSGIADIGAIGVEGTQGPHHTHHDGHRMRIGAKALEELHHLLVHHPMPLELRLEVRELIERGQLAFDEQVGDLGERARGCEILDSVPPMQQHPTVSIDEGDRTHARGGGCEAGIVGQEGCEAGEAAHVNDSLTHAAARREDGKLTGVNAALILPAERHLGAPCLLCQPGAKACGRRELHSFDFIGLNQRVERRAFA